MGGRDSRQRITGRVERSAVSGKTNYLVAGFEMEDGRPITEGSKYKAAIEKNVKILSEDGLLKMIRDSDPAGSAQFEKQEEERKEKERVRQEKQLETLPVEVAQSSLLTTKYAPQSMASLIGNSSAVQNVFTWLQQWNDVHIRSNTSFSFSFRNHHDSILSSEPWRSRNPSQRTPWRGKNDHGETP